MRHLGDFAPLQTVRFLWSTNGANGASITRATNGTVSVYKDGGTTQTTTGVTDTEDFDTLTGIHLCEIATSDSFYAAGSHFDVVLSGATIDSQTVNAVLGSFTIGRTGLVVTGTLSGTHSSTTADLGTNAPSVDVSGMTLWFPSHKVARNIDSYNTGTGVATFTPSTAVTLADGNVWYLFATPPASTGSPPAVNVTQNAGSAITATSGVQEVKVQSIANNAITANAINNDAITAAKIATDAIDSDALAASAVDEIIDEVIEGSTTLRQLMRGFASALLGKASGMATTTGTFRDLADTKARITATQDADGNRTAVTLDLT